MPFEPQDIRIDLKLIGYNEKWRQHQYAVVVTHIPTGLKAEAREAKSQIRNKAIALKMLEKLVARA